MSAAPANGEFSSVWPVSGKTFTVSFLVSFVMLLWESCTTCSGHWIESLLGFIISSSTLIALSWSIACFTISSTWAFRFARLILFSAKLTISSTNVCALRFAWVVAFWFVSIFSTIILATRLTSFRAVAFYMLLNLIFRFQV